MGAFPKIILYQEKATVIVGRLIFKDKPVEATVAIGKLIP